MAKVFKNYGIEQTGAPVCIVPWQKCPELLGIDPLSRCEERPKFGEQSSWPFPSRFVVHLENPEAKEQGVQPGFFESPLIPEEAEDRLNRYTGREAE
jgi:hypothetical protein